MEILLDHWQSPYLKVFDAEAMSEQTNKKQRQW